MPVNNPQLEFEFVSRSRGKSAIRFEILRRPTWDCSKDRHQVLPNGTCQWCRKQIYYGVDND